MPNGDTRRGRELEPWHVLAVIALVAGLLGTLHTAMGHLIMPRFVPLTSDTLSEGVHWGMWIALSPVMGAVVKRYPIASGNLRRGLIASAVLAAVLVPLVGLALGASRYRIMIWMMDAGTRGRMRWNPPVAIPVSVVEALGDYVVILGLYHAFALYREARSRQLQASELARHLDAARLRALHAQLHPHFLFNALNSIATLAQSNGDAARDMLVRLSDLLRRTLGTADRAEVPLSEELDFLERYLAIEAIRFQDRLRVTFEVDDGALEAYVPGLILQPIVENAVRHGISRRSQSGTIAIRATTRADRLQLAVEDNGPGLPPRWTLGRTGIGLANVRARLDQLFGANYSLEFTPGADGGLLVRIDCPLRAAPNEPGSSLRSA